MGIEAQLTVAAFVAGLLTILAPCVIPVLPIIIGSSVSENKNRLKPLIITGSLMVSVVIFTLILRATTDLFGLSEDTLTTVAGFILAIFGFFMIFPQAWDWISLKAGFSNSSNKFLAKASKKGGVAGDALIGVSLGPVFTSCSPTFGIIVGIVLAGDVAIGTFYLSIYAIGLGIMLLAIAYAGQALTSRIGWATDPHGWFRRIIGILFIMVGIAIITGFDRTLETWVLDGGFYDWVIDIEAGLND